MDQNQTYQGTITNFACLNTSLASTSDSATNTSYFAWRQDESTMWAFSPVPNSDNPNKGLIIRTVFEAPATITHQSIISIIPLFMTQNTLLTAAASIGLTLTIQTSSSSPSPTTSSVATPTATSASTDTSTHKSTDTDSASATSGTLKLPKTYSSGELIGAVIGCFIAGLLIASAAGFWCFRRWARHQTRRYESRREIVNNGVLKVSPKVATGFQSSWQKHSPQPESDQTIARLVNRTLDDIELFVETYYVDQPVLAGRVTTSGMSRFNSPHLGFPLAKLIQTSAAATLLLKHCIAYRLLRKIDPTRNDPLSLLRTETGISSQDNKEPSSEVRILMAHPQLNAKQDEKYLGLYEEAVQTIIQQMEHAFLPWAQGTAQDRAKTFRGVVMHAGELGRILFSQPAVFQWRWIEGRSASEGEMVMLPGLDKVTDSQAVPLEKPICIVQPRTSQAPY